MRARTTFRSLFGSFFRSSCCAFLLLGGLAESPPVLAEAALTPAAATEKTSLPNPARFALAVEQGDIATVSAWLAAGLPVDFMGDRIGSGLMIAAWEGHLALLELFIQHGAQIELRNRHDENALLLASWRGHLAAVRWLLDHGAQARRTDSRWSALHYAAFANRPDIARLLIERGGDPNARAPNGSTVLMMAAREGHAELVQQLLGAGADPKAVNENGDSALSWAMRHEHFSIAQSVSQPSEFAQAVQARPLQARPAPRSLAAPAEIEDLLRQIRLAEAAGQSPDKLRAQLQAAIERFKQESQHIVIGATGQRKTTPPRGKPQALMITARRRPATAQSPSTAHGERAELLYAPAPPAALAQENPAPGDDTPRIADLLARLQQAQARGQATQALREELFRAVARHKSTP